MPKMGITNFKIANLPQCKNSLKAVLNNRSFPFFRERVFEISATIWIFWHPLSTVAEFLLKFFSLLLIHSTLPSPQLVLRKRIIFICLRVFMFLYTKICINLVSMNGFGFWILIVLHIKICINFVYWKNVPHDIFAEIQDNKCGKECN
jgi:hypothetical protein